MSYDEFLSIPELNQNPLASRVIAILDKDGGGDVNFEEFLESLQVFSKADKEAKLKCKPCATHAFVQKQHDVDL